MYDTSPIAVQQDLDGEIPTKKLDRNLLIAAWNIRVLTDVDKGNTGNGSVVWLPNGIV